MVDGILHRILAVRDGVVRVEARDGVVTLVGELDRHSAAATAARLAQAVPGVVAVDDRLTFDVDDVPLSHSGPSPRRAQRDGVVAGRAVLTVAGERDR